MGERGTLFINENLFIIRRVRAAPAMHGSSNIYHFFFPFPSTPNYPARGSREATVVADCNEDERNYLRTRDSPRPALTSG